MNSTFRINTAKEKTFPDRLLHYYKIIGFEVIVWITSFIYLAFFVDPFQSHFTICPLANAGFEFCPGCGLGNSIALLFRGDFVHSFESHFLGVPALVIILYRVFTIVRSNKKRNQTIK